MGDAELHEQQQVVHHLGLLQHGDWRQADLHGVAHATRQEREERKRQSVEVLGVENPLQVGHGGDGLVEPVHLLAAENEVGEEERQDRRRARDDLGEEVETAPGARGLLTRLRGDLADVRLVDGQKRLADVVEETLRGGRVGLRHTEENYM